MAPAFRHNQPMRLSAFLFASLLTLGGLLAGCRPDERYYVLPQAPKKYTTAASLSPGTSEILGARMYVPNLVGRTDRCNWPANVPAAPVVMSGVTPNYEKLRQISPGIIVYDAQLFSEQEKAKLKELGFDTFELKGNTLEEFEKSLYEMAAMLQGEAETAKYIENIHSEVTAAQGAPPTKNFRVAIMMPGEGSEHMIAGTESFYADVVRKAGATPVGPRGDQFVPASAESLVSMNPEVIVSSGFATSIEKDPRLQTIAAVKGKRFIPFNPDILLRRGARVDTLIRNLYKALSGLAVRKG